MDAMDQFDMHYKLAEFYRQVRNERRQHEWRLTLGLWLTLAAGIVAAKDLPPIPICVVIVFLLVVFAFHLLWGVLNFKLRNRDADRAYEHLIRAEEFSGLVLAEHSDDLKKKRKLYDKVPFFEMLGTILLCLAFGIVYYFKELPIITGQ
jgi:hypothetical protein